MERGDVDHLDRLARRVDAPGPVAVLDPLSRNVLTSDQGAGLGAAAGKWSRNAAELGLYGGQFGAYLPNSVSVDSVPADGAALYWDHPVWPGFPVAAGVPFTWWVPGLRAAGAALRALRIDWHDASGAYLSGNSTTNVTRPMVATPHSRAVYARPSVRFAATGLWQLGASVLAVGNTSAALAAGEAPAGEGCPPYSITSYAHAATPGDGRYRDLSLELTEVVA
ncbi:hypothetical protein ACFU6O_03830 [Streptomyces albidoflavus]